MNVTDWPMWHWRARLVSVHDGDTLWAEVDQGFRNTVTISVRVRNINAPELVGDTKPAGINARDHLASLLAGTDWLYLITEKDHQSFNRYVADVFIADASGDLINIGQRMIDDGYAVAWP